ncbi:MAG: 3-isopropylmalate dehydratase [Thermoplasmatales archaeon]|nr:3-isopropylmalate dehydratase [Thermoplasmatales archaeon]
MKGRVWKFGDDVDTDQILPAERLVSENIDRLHDFLFEKVRPGMASEVAKGDIIVAGRNFGCGSSREHAPRAIIDAGISCVVAESYSRIFYRNSINLGLRVLVASADVGDGETVEIDLDGGKIISASGTYDFPPPGEFEKSMIESGGLMGRLKR